MTMGEEGVRKALGRGLAALIGDAGNEASVLERARSQRRVPIEFLRPNPRNPRKSFADDDLADLTASIREKGIVQPILVRRVPDAMDAYEIIAGERRWRAAQRAGLSEVPVLVKAVPDQSALALALIENIQREDLNAVEEAEAYHALQEKFTLSQEELAKRVGKDRSTIANALRLLRLPSDIKKDIVEDRLAMGHARALLALDVPEQMKEARDVIVKGNLTVRGAEALIKRIKSCKTVRSRTQKPDAALSDVTEQLVRHYKAKVAIRTSGKGGKIEIAFNGQQELTRIVELLLASE
jgi:ParB family chromosome partitioning protein